MFAQRQMFRDDAWSAAFWMIAQHLGGANVGERGSHPDLLARGGIYADLYLTQARAYA